MPRVGYVVSRRARQHSLLSILSCKVFQLLPGLCGGGLDTLGPALGVVRLQRIGDCMLR